MRLCEFMIAADSPSARRCPKEATELVGTIDLCEHHAEIARQRLAEDRPFSVLSQFGKEEVLAEEGREPTPFR